MEDDARRLRAARAWAGLSQLALGEKIGRPNKSYIARREDGTYPLSTADRIAIAHVCGLPIQWFYVDIPYLLSRIPLEEPAAGRAPRRIPPPGTDEAQKRGA